jgi:hypothetical protein
MRLTGCPREVASERHLISEESQSGVREAAIAAFTIAAAQNVRTVPPTEKASLRKSPYENSQLESLRRGTHFRPRRPSDAIVVAQQGQCVV